MDIKVIPQSIALQLTGLLTIQVSGTTNESVISIEGMILR